MKPNRHSPPDNGRPLERAPTAMPTTATVPISSLAPIAPPPRLETALPDGLRLGTFEIKGVISQSRAAVIYRAHDHGLGVPAAIKEFMPVGVARRGRGDMVEPIEPWHEDTVDLGRREFIAESRAFARCDDPSLLRVTQLWELNGTAYRVMPLYSGKRLADLRRHMKAPIEEVALRAILKRLLDALAAFHASAGVHGNVTPANILMPSLDHPVLLGTGRTGMLLATELGESGRTDFEAAFAAPEQFDPNVPVGVPTDLFGLAQTLRYCITGGPPIGHESLRAAIHRMLGAGAVSAYSDALLDALTSASAIVPAERPQSLDEFRQRLRRLEAQGAAAATAPPTAPPTAAPATAPAPTAAATPTTAPIAAASPVVTALRTPLVPPSAELAPEPAPVAPIASIAPPAPVTPTPIATPTMPPWASTTPPAFDTKAASPESLEEPVDETIDVSSVLGDLMQSPAEPPPARPGTRAPERTERPERSERSERPEPKAHEPRVEPTLNFGAGSPSLRISELPDRTPRAPASRPERAAGVDPASAPGAFAATSAGAFAGAADAAPGAPFVFHMHGFDNGDPFGATAPRPMPVRKKRSFWQVLRLGTFTVVLAAVTVVTILAVSGVWDPRGPELKLPSLHWPETAPSPSTNEAAPPRPATETTAPTPTPTPPAVETPAPPQAAPQQPAAASAAVPPFMEAAPTSAAAAPAPAAPTAAAPPTARAAAKSPPSRESASSKRHGTTPASGEAAVASPREACAGRTQFALYRCMQAQCERARWSSHPECVRLRKSDEAG